MFEKLIDQGRPGDAFLVLKNKYNRDLTSEENFKDFFNFCLEISKSPEDPCERLTYVDEARTALDQFLKNCIMTEEALELINQSTRKIELGIAMATRANEEGLYHGYNQVTQENQILINQLKEEKEKLEETKDIEEIDYIVEKYLEIEEDIYKPFICEKQEEEYDQVSREINQLIREKIDRISYYESISYNKQALESFQQVLLEFKAREEDYLEDFDSLKDLLLDGFFEYEVYELFNETNQYFNYVYHYIFNKLKDEEKVKLTRLIIESR